MDIFQIFENLTIADIQAYVDQGQEENLWLDFKVPNNSSLKSADDKRNLARAISGFANSSGGLIVWGVDARKNSNDIDCAVELKPIENIKLLLTRLNTLTGDGVDPTVNGVAHRVIEIENGKGFAISLIPESDIGPHMSKLGEDRYYKRSGDSFYKMEHYDVADMFGKRRKPKLKIFYKVFNAGTNLQVVIGLKNEGIATATAPYLAIGCSGPLLRDRFGLDGNGHEGLPYSQSFDSNLPWAYGGSMDLAIHPKMSRSIAKLSLGHIERPPPTDDQVIRYAIACENQPFEEGELRIPIEELQ
jgi:hypothetical protein